MMYSPLTKHGHTISLATAGVLLFILTVFFAYTTTTEASPNAQINYQGKLTTATNVAVPDGTYNMRFWLLTSPTIATTSAVWTESLTGTNRVQVTNGLFSVMLGSTTPFTGVDFNQTLYLGVEIGSTTVTAQWDGEMSPRKVLGTVPAAFEADKLDGLNSTQFVRTDATSTIAVNTADTLLTITQNGTGDILNLFDGTTEVLSVLDGGNIGIGSTSPSRKLTIAGDMLVQNFIATGTATTTNLALSGKFFDVNSSPGTNGMVLQTTGSGIQWVATSTLGFAGVTDFLALSDVSLGSYTANRILFTSASEVVDSANFTFDGANFRVAGNSEVTGTATSTNLVASSTLRLVGGTSFPTNPPEGTMFFSSASTSLYVYEGGKWQADRTTATFIVAASDTQNKEKADYVASGTNDQDTIEQALAALPSHGGLVYLLPGTYNINNEINITQASTTLMGSGPSTLLKITATSTSWDVIDVANASYVTIKDLAIDGSRASAGNQDGISLSSVSSSTISGVRSNRMRSDGLSMTGAEKYNIYVVGGTFESNAGNGLYADAVTNLTITESVFSNNTGYSIQLSAVKQSIIASNDLRGSGSYNLVLVSASDYNTISGNRITNATSIGILLSGVSYNNVSNNIIRDGGSGGILMQSSADYNTIANNTIAGNATYGVYVGSSNNTVVGNKIHNNTGSSANSSIVLASAASSLIADNTITDTAGTGYAIDIDAGSAGNTLAGNTYSGLGAASIRDLATNTKYTQSDRITLGTANTQTHAIFKLNASSSSSTAEIIQQGTGSILDLYNSASRVLTVTNAGRLGIGTTTPAELLSVAGNMHLTGGFYDRTYSAGTNGMVLQTTGSGVQWVATSTLGLTSGATAFLGLTDTISSYTANRVIYTNGSANALTDSANFTFNGSVLSVNGSVASGYFTGTSSTATSTILGALGIGTTSPTEKFVVADSKNGGTSVEVNNANTGSAAFARFISEANGGSLSMLAFGTGYANSNQYMPDAGLIEASGMSAGLNISNLVDAPIRFWQAGSEVARVHTGGNVGIGTSTPTSKLHVWGNLAVGISGTPLLFADATNGKVGIGTSTPGERLSVFQSVNSGVTMEVENSNTGSGAFARSIARSDAGSMSFFALGSGYSTSNQYIADSGLFEASLMSNGIGVSTVTDAPIRFWQGNIERARFNTGGFFGIGTTSPSALLSVTGTSTNKLFAFASSTGNLLSLTSAGQLNFGTSSSANIFINGGPTSTIAGPSVYNVGVGNETFSYISNTTNPAMHNIGLGYRALYGSSSAPMSGDHNIALGSHALSNNATGSQNIAIGMWTLRFNTDGSENAAIGDQVLYSNTTGSYNYGLGNGALYNNTTGSYNSAISKSALFANTIGEYNIAFGPFALYANSTGSNNNALGYRAGYTNTIGTGNTYIGYYADALSNDLSTSTAIGAGAKVGCSNCLTLGGTGLNTVNVGIGTTTPWKTLSVVGDMSLSGAFFDSASTSGTNGMVLQTIGTGVQWVATSTLGLGGGADGVSNWLYDGSRLSPSSTVGVGIFASSTIGGGTGATGLTILGNATTTGDIILSGVLYSKPNTGGCGTCNSIDLTATVSSANNDISVSARGQTGFYTNSSLIASIGSPDGISGIGIGDSAFDARFEISLDGSTSNKAFMVSSNDNTDGDLLTVDGTGRLGIGTTTPWAKLAVMNTFGASIPLFDIATTTSASYATSSIFRVNHDGKVGIGTTSPYANLTVSGTLGLTGALYDRTASAGTNGMVLQTTGTGVQWVATSTLGLGGTSLFTDGGAYLYPTASTESLLLGATNFVGMPGLLALNATSTSGTLLYASSSPSFTGNFLDFRGGSGGSSLFFVDYEGRATSYGSGFVAYVSSTTLNKTGLDIGHVLSVPTASHATDTASISFTLLTPTPGITVSHDVLSVSDTSIFSYAGTNSYTVTSNLLDLDRSVIAGTSDTVNLSGAVAVITDACSGSTCVSSANALEINQTYTGNTGSALNITTASTNGGLAFRVNDDGTFTDSTPFVVDSFGRVGIGTTTPSALLSITGLSTTTNLFNFASSTGSTLLALGADGRLKFGTSTAADIFLNGGATTTNPQGNGNNVAIGNQAFSYYTPGSATYNIALGYQALYGSSSVPMTGGNNVAIGYQALMSNTSGVHNVGIGTNALSANQTGSYNVGFGSGALMGNVGGAFNSAFGVQAMYSNTNGADNTAFGTNAMYSNTTGSYNVAVGSGALYLNGASWSNVAVGKNALFTTITGASSTALGTFAGFTNITGSNNLYLGDEADSISAALSNAIAIGSHAKVGASHAMVLGGSGIWNTNIVTGTSTPWAKFSIQNNYGSTTALFDIATTTSAGYATTSLFNVQADGRVGIGTSTPLLNHQLVVSGVTAGKNLQAMFQTPEGSYGYIDFASGAMSNGGSADYRLLLNNAGSGNLDFQGGQSGLTNILSLNAANMYVYTGTGSRFGVSTSTPAATLAVAGAGTTNPLLIASSTGETLFRVDYDGRVSIGSSTPESSTLTIQKTGITGTTTAGIKQYLGFATANQGALSFGNNMYIVNAPTATSTLVANIVRIVDGTSLGNTVRGFEIQAHRGSNTKGENTGLSAFGRTFGLRGTTEGDAGSTFAPAGVFAESRGVTQGNALRAYSGTITTANLVSLFQDTSAFSGTGLLMNFGNSGGSFAATSSAKFLDMQVGGSSRFTITAAGTTTIGDGTTNYMAGLQIGYGGLCVDNDGSCAATTSGRITSVSSATGNSDLAEMYFARESLMAGEIVMADGGLSIARADTESRSRILGVVSTKPGLLLGFDDTSLTPGETAYPVALKGRVPIRLSTENGPIAKGDRITLSSVPGVGMKATESDVSVGIALEDFDGESAYTAGFLNQFGDDLVKAKLSPRYQDTDVRAQDGCYYGAGSEEGEEECDPKKVKSVKPVTISVDERTVALRELEREDAATTTLEDGTEVRIGQALLFVQLENHIVRSELDILAALNATSSLANGNGEETMFDRLKELANAFVDGVLRIAGIKADEVQTDKLCVGETCVDEATLRALLNAQGQSPVAPSQNMGSTPEPEPAPEVEGGEILPGGDAGGSTTGTPEGEGVGDTTPTESTEVIEEEGSPESGEVDSIEEVPEPEVAPEPEPAPAPSV